MASCGKMTLPGSTDARVLLSIVGSGKLPAGSKGLCFWAACMACRFRRRRVAAKEMAMRIVVTTNAISNWKAMKALRTVMGKKVDE